MKIVVDPNSRGSVLAQWRGAQAKIWIFDVSLRRMAIRLHAPNETEVLYVVAIGCNRIVGPFSWQDADIEIVKLSSDPKNYTACLIMDKKNGFELTCSDAVVVRGPATDFDKTLDNFLGEG